MSETGTASRRPARPPLWLRLLPRRGVSRWVGRLARRRPPRRLLTPCLSLYARAYGVRRDEMARPLADYASFVDFFTRALRADARPMPDDPAAIVSPADGRVAATGTIETGTLVQAKGISYRVGDLLGDGTSEAVFEGGTYLVVYLAPGDYHRFHWPFDARVASVRHIPGDLWPVNAGAVASVPRLFAVNERVVVRGRIGRDGDGPAFAFVAVGALDVGSIRLAFAELATNRKEHDRRRGMVLDLTPSPAPVGIRGEELGRFELGSTVILLVAPPALLDPLGARRPVRVGGEVGVCDVTRPEVPAPRPT